MSFFNSLLGIKEPPKEEKKPSKVEASKPSEAETFYQEFNKGKVNFCLKVLGITQDEYKEIKDKRKANEGQSSPQNKSVPTDQNKFVAQVRELINFNSGTVRELENLSEEELVQLVRNTFKRTYLRGDIAKAVIALLYVDDKKAAYSKRKR